MRTISAALAALLGAAALASPVAAKPTHSTGPSRASAAALFDTAVKFRNRHGTTGYVAFMRYDPDGCGGDGNWQTKGWLKLAPGETKGFSTSNRYAYYYAKATDGTKWSG